MVSLFRNPFSTTRRPVMPDQKDLYDALVAKQEAARERAMAKLEESLTAQQLYELNNRGYFYVTGQSGKRYRIIVNGSITGNVDREDGARFCVALRGAYDMALGDHYLAQALMIRTDETEFLNVAVPMARRYSEYTMERLGYFQ